MIVLPLARAGTSCRQLALLCFVAVFLRTSVPFCCGSVDAGVSEIDCGSSWDLHAAHVLLLQWLQVTLPALGVPLGIGTMPSSLLQNAVTLTEPSSGMMLQ
jgi:hypothetical protein